MRRTAQLRRCLQEAEVLTTPVVHDPLHAKGAERVDQSGRFPQGKVSVRRGSHHRRILSNSRKRREAHPLGTDASDEALIKAIARSDRHAMAVLYRHHHVRVYRFALRVTGDASLAEDIVSEVFFEVWRHADRFKSEGPGFHMAAGDSTKQGGLRRSSAVPASNWTWRRSKSRTRQTIRKF